MQVVLHEDKKYYPTANETYGPDVEVCGTHSIYTVYLLSVYLMVIFLALFSAWLLLKLFSTNYSV